jgi:predicted DNA-binding helix-hairpin-helix protein
MDTTAKIELLSEDARFEACDSFTPRRPSRRAKRGEDRWSDGPAKALFRVLQSNSCEWDCPYCPLRRSNDVPRTSLAPEELAGAFMQRVEGGEADGLFLSSGVDGGLRPAVARMIDTVELLRLRYEYKGYIHLKLMPGTRPDEVERAASLADRISINLEAPNGDRLKRIAPDRRWQNVVEPMRYVRDAQQEGMLPAGQATQLVVGAAGETDREVVASATRMYNEFLMRRVYFSAFRPQQGTPMADHEPTPFVRQQRLQEADWLVRHYGFNPSELPFDPDDNLPLQLDPKFAWALAHPDVFPIEVNTADRETLLRVPGIGPISLERIIALRRTVRFREVEHIRKLGAVAEKARHFLLFDGRYFGGDLASVEARLRARPIAEQLPLW